MTRRNEEPDYPPAELAAWREGRRRGHVEAFWLAFWLGVVLTANTVAVGTSLVLWPRPTLIFLAALTFGVTTGLLSVRAVLLRNRRP